MAKKFLQMRKSSDVFALKGQVRLMQIFKIQAEQWAKIFKQAQQTAKVVLLVNVRAKIQRPSDSQAHRTLENSINQINQNITVTNKEEQRPDSVPFH